MKERRLIRLPEVKRLVGLSTSTIYELVRKQQFPARVILTPSVVGWDHDEIQAWIEERLAAPRDALPRGKRLTALKAAA